MHVAFTQKSFRSSDGTEIAYQVAGEGGAMPIILANGLGGNFSTWIPVLERLGGPRRVLTWDYRGLYGSKPPSSPTTASLGPAAQARDLEELLALEKIDRAIFVGWSMGVQVNFEAARRFPARVAGIVAINGVAGKPFATALGCSALRRMIPFGITQMRKNARFIGPITRVGLRIPGLFAAMAKLGLVGSVDIAMFTDFAQSFSQLDFDVYGATLSALGEHDATDVLPKLRIPLTIVAGDRDVMTPVTTAKAMQALVPNARLRILLGGTHYTPVEFPDEVTAELERVIAEVDAGARYSAEA